MSKRRGPRRPILAVSLVAGLAAAVLQAAPMSAARAGGPRVLRVGRWHGRTGQFQSIQAAVDAARPGDWILVGPGDYHESPSKGTGVMITTPRLHLRGMNRNLVVVDGAKPTTDDICSSEPQDQNLGPVGEDGTHEGRNGIVVYKVNGVYVENLTACNFLTGPGGEEGNQIWWNGGDGSGKIGMSTYWGNYLTATSYYSNGVANPRGEYGIFVSNAKGPGSINDSYASNMGDAAYYIGACPDCNAVLNRAHAQYSALGYSGTNSGGHLIIKNSEFDHNKSGFTSNSQNNDDAPSPQNGLCPGDGETGPIGTSSCTVLMDNFFHDNNNPNVPGAGDGLAGASPVGTGVVLAGTEYTTLWHNRVTGNGAWGVLVVDLPDQEEPPPISNCEGGIYIVPGELCYYQAFGNDVAANSFKQNGFFGNPTNGDIGLATTLHDPGNCFRGNTDPNGLTSDPLFIQSEPYNPCGQPNQGDMGPLVAQAACASQIVAPCPDLPEASYPRPTHVVLPKVPPQPSMPNPCAGVPTNPWCPPGATATVQRSGAAAPVSGASGLAAVAVRRAGIGTAA